MKKEREKREKKEREKRENREKKNGEKRKAKNKWEEGWGEDHGESILSRNRKKRLS